MVSRLRKGMKHFTPLFLGVLGTIGIILPAHFVMNREAKLRCLEGGSQYRLVQGTTYLGDTTLCVHYLDIKTPFVSLK